MSQFVHMSPVSGQHKGFSLVVIVNSVAINVHCAHLCAEHAQCLFSSVPLGMYPVLRFVDHMVVLLCFLVAQLYCFHVAGTVYIPIVSVWRVFLLKPGVWMWAHVCWYVCHGVCVVVRGQLSGVSYRWVTETQHRASGLAAGTQAALPMNPLSLQSSQLPLSAASLNLVLTYAAT